MQKRIIGYLERQSDLMIVGLSLILALIIGWIDYWVTVDVNLSIFYLFPITLATWFSGKYSGLVLAVFNTILWANADLYVKQYSNSLFIYWNIGVRLAFFSIVIYLLVSLKKAYEREKKLARIDGLTGVYNRSFFIETLENEIQRAQRYHYSITLAYLDIDYFKKVNDKFGHNIGDRLLQDISNSLQKSLRPTDLVARLGGDEFAILLPHTNLEEAKAALDRVYEQLLRLNRDQLSFVGFSMGVVTCLTLPPSIDILIEQADRLMYSVKHTGKNRPEYALFDPVSQKIDL
ncbi:GGDEF domain-containing protein [Capilliphycus salinus ALCB114379]|uniref:GGDEF domain-containing protein n=1 Tax=Capilliphycus salinus TaxID=2768948 RepID=UPI0039A6B1CE